MQYNKEVLRDMANQIDLVEYASRTIEFTKHSGYNHYAECCFHKEKTPSLCFNDKNNTYHCFGCGASGNIYTWIKETEGLSFPESIQKVAQMIGIDPDDYIESDTVGFYKELNSFCECNKINTQRQILDIERDYNFKYSNELPQEWIEEGITPESMREYNIRIDSNARRIVYPVFDANDNFISVKGRTRIPSFKELGIAKYMNYYKIGTIDYFQGWQQALSEIKNKKSVIIFEGIKSCMKSWGWGIRNTVASECSELTNQQIQLLIHNGVQEVVIAWDNDKPFQKIVSNPEITMLKKFTKVSVIKDNRRLLGSPKEKMAPVDKGELIYRKLIDERVSI